MIVWAIKNNENKFFSQLVLAKEDAPNFNIKWTINKIKIFKTKEKAKKKKFEIDNLAFEDCKIVKVEIKEVGNEQV